MILRDAVADDLPAIVALLADDETAAAREDARQPLDGRTVGTMQLSYLAGLSFRGAWRQQIEAVRIASEMRGQGLGAAMIRWAIDRAHERDCKLVQLTSAATRVGAHRFYERIGFAKTHVGMKLHLRD